MENISDFTVCAATFALCGALVYIAHCALKAHQDMLATLSNVAMRGCGTNESIARFHAEAASDYLKGVKMLNAAITATTKHLDNRDPGWRKAEATPGRETATPAME